MASAVLMANALLMSLYAMNTNGKLMSTSSQYSGTGVMAVMSSEMPVTPPSIKWVGIKKLSSPNAAEPMPDTIKKTSLAKLAVTIFKSRKPLARSYDE